MILRLELESIGEHVPSPARFVICHLYRLDAHQPDQRRLVGRLSLDEDTARALAELVNGEPWPEREWRSPYGDDDLDDDDGPAGEPGSSNSH